MSYGTFFSPRLFLLAKHLFPSPSALLRLNDKHFWSASIEFRIEHERSRSRRNMKIVSQSKKTTSTQKKYHKIYGRTFFIGLINFLVASSCWYVHFYAYRHVKLIHKRFHISRPSKKQVRTSGKKRLQSIIDCKRNTSFISFSASLERSSACEKT